MHRSLVLILAAALPPLPALSQDDETADRVRLCTPRPSADPDEDYRIPLLCADPPRVRPHEQIYAVYQRAEDDDNAGRLHYSFRYTLFTPNCIARYRAQYDRDDFKNRTPAEKSALADAVRECLKEYDNRSEWYLMYTGQFDFYWGTRDSGPVVNRVSNPGAHYRRYTAKGLRPAPGGNGEREIHLRWWDVGVEHRSNGQTTDAYALAPDGRYRADLENESGNRAYIDSISQDTNYLSVEAAYEYGERVQFALRVKPFYFSNDTAVTWGPLLGQQVRMQDYDRARFSVEWTFGATSRQRARQRRLDLEWTVGDKALKTDSLNAALYWPATWGDWTIPLYLRAHYGPLQTLSDFTREQASIGAGLLLLE
jgi:hypothetical protein